MLSACWKIGLQVHSRTIRAVAVRLRRDGWQLCHWQQIPWQPDSTCQQRDGLVQALTAWRRQLPPRHDVRMAFSASRTVQRQLANPGVLREADCERYIASTTAQQMQMTSDQLCWDYQPCKHNNTLHVTAAHHNDVTLFCDCATTLALNLTAVTPDASALSRFFPWLPAHIQALCCYDDEHWLWASRQQWGVVTTAGDAGFAELCDQLSLNQDQLAVCGNLPARLADSLVTFDPWQTLRHTCLPPPEAGGHFAVALGLAIGDYPAQSHW